MLAHMAVKISSFFVSQKIIDQDDEEVYQYSFEILISTLINFIALYGVALITNRVWETTLFVVGFIPLRSLAGGYHAKTHFRCFLVLMVSYFLFLVIVLITPPYIYILINLCCVVASLILVWLLSPIEDKNKPLNSKEKKHFKKRSRITIIIYMSVLVFGIILFNTRIEFFCLSLGIVSASLSLAAARIRNRIVKESIG